MPCALRRACRPLTATAPTANAGRPEDRAESNSCKGRLRNAFVRCRGQGDSVSPRRAFLGGTARVRSGRCAGREVRAKRVRTPGKEDV